MCVYVFSNHSAPRQFLTSETQHPEAAWPDADDDDNNAGKNAIASKQMLKKTTDLVLIFSMVFSRAPLSQEMEACLCLHQVTEE